MPMSSLWKMRNTRDVCYLSSERKYEQRLISFHAFTGLRACRVKVDNSACEVSLQIPLHDAGNVMTAANPACSVLLL